MYKLGGQKYTNIDGQTAYLNKNAYIVMDQHFLHIIWQTYQKIKKKIQSKE